MATGSAERIAGLWQRRINVARRIIPAIMIDLKPTAEVLLQFWLARLIYSIPEAMSSAGRKKWVRTGRLRAGERVTVGPGGADTIELKMINAVSYAEPRHEAGKPGRQRTRRPAHWHDETVKALKERLREYAKSATARIAGGT